MAVISHGNIVNSKSEWLLKKRNVEERVRPMTRQRPCVTLVSELPFGDYRFEPPHSFIKQLPHPHLAKLL